MRNKKILSLLLSSLLAINMLSGCQSTDKPAEKTKNISEVQGYKFVKDSTFLVKDEKIISQDEIPEQSKIIDWYLDPYCSACTKLESILRSKHAEITKNMVIRYHVMSFLSAQSMDDYSNRAAAYILSVVENYPELGLKYFNKIIDDKFRPDPNKGEITEDTKFQTAFKEIGGNDDQWSKVSNAHVDLIKMVRKATPEVFASKEIVNKTVKGKLSVPLIIIGTSEKALDFSEALDAETFFMESLNKYLEKNKEQDKKTPTEDTKKTEETTKEKK